MSLNDEEQLIGELLLRPDLLAEIQTLVEATDFSSPPLAACYRWITTHKLTGKPGRDAREFQAFLIREKVQFETRHGETNIQVIERILNSTGGHFAAHHARVIAAEHTTGRVLQSLANSTKQIRNLDPFAEPDAIQDQLAATLNELHTLQAATTKGTCSPVREILPFALQEIEARLAGQAPLGVTTGITGLDQLLSGLRPQQLIVLAARPGCGKSALAANIAAQACHKAGATILFASLEMSAAELTERLLSSESGVPLSRMTAGQITTAHRNAITEAAAEIAQWNLLIDDRPDLRVHDILAQARKIQANPQSPPLTLLIVDYLQLVRPQSTKEPRQEQVAGISRALKQAAKALNIPVLALAQLNRQADTNEPPKLSHLRESGGIEADADTVLFLHHNPTDRSHANPNEQRPCELLIAKQRNGPTGSIQLEWNPAVVTFKQAFPKKFDFLQNNTPHTTYLSDNDSDNDEHQQHNFQFRP